MTAHNLSRGFYCLDHTTGDVVAGPFSNRNGAALVAGCLELNCPPYVILEVVGDLIPWLGGAVGNVCVDAATAAASYEDRVDCGDHEVDTLETLPCGNDWDAHPTIG